MEYFSFLFNDTATTEIYTLSLHDALPICGRTSRRATCAGTSRSCGSRGGGRTAAGRRCCCPPGRRSTTADRKSTRLNSSHANISYAVFCLKKKKPHLYYDPGLQERGRTVL